MLDYYNIGLKKEDVDFLNYCREHSKTPRALFSPDYATRLNQLMGFVDSEPVTGWPSIHEEQMEGILERIVKYHTENK